MNTEQIFNLQKLAKWIKQFGWQGGTRHQVYEEIERRLKLKGFIKNIDGIWCTLVTKI